MLDKTKKDWWKSAVAYQIYPKSFQDTTGSGVGDLQGIIRRLDYLQTLGIDVIWLSPVCASPQVDNGYDISDYRAIDPMFGDLADMRQLIQEGKKRGIGIMMDLVLNHSSDQHRWFLQAKTSRDNPYHDYYVWRDGTPDQFPNDMQAVFGGPAWEWVPEVEQYYFHQFAPQQPDLNWENPALRREIYDMILWWMEQGVEGFRLDVIDQIAKEPDNKITNNGPRLYEFLRELSAETFQKGCLVTVGEAWGADIPRAKLYSAPDGSELSMVFQFEQMVLDQQPGKDKWDLAQLPFVKMKQSYARWQQGLHGCGWNSLFLNNHAAPHCFPLGRRRRIPGAVRQAAGHHAARHAGHTLHLSGRRTGHDQRSPAAGAVSGCGDPQHVQKAAGRGLPGRRDSALHLRQRAGQRPYPHAVERRSERRFHHRYPLAAGEPELHDHQCRGCSGGPGLGVLAL